jgi:hypothetical protein
MLRGATARFGSLDDGLFDEQRIERDFASTSDVTAAQCWYWVCKLRARFIGGDYATALDAASRAQRLLSMSLTIMEAADYHFYSALSQAAFCDSVPTAQRTSNLEALAAHHRQLASWATACPENFEDRASPTNSPRDSTRPAGSRQSPTPICATLGITTSFGERAARSVSWTKHTRTCGRS